MKLGKKSIGIFLCFASVFTVLAGCKKKTKKNTTNVTTKANTTKINTTKINTTKVNTTKATTKQKTTTDPKKKYMVNEDVFNSFLNISSYEELKALNYTCDYVDKWGSQTVYASNGTFMAIKHNGEEDDETLLYQTSASTTKDVELKIYTYNGSTWSEYSTMNLNFFDFLRDYGRMLQIDYSSFAYDEVEKCYKLDNYEVDLNLNYTDIKVSFEYGKISRMSYTVNNFSNSWDVAVTFTNVGNTSFFY